jgi:uncharacterized protein (DUF1800 family)
LNAAASATASKNAAPRHEAANGRHRVRLCLSGFVALMLAACALPPAPPMPHVAAVDPVTRVRWIDRVTWGADAGTLKEVEATGLAPWLGRQLHPGPARLPPAAQAQIDAMRITTTSPEALAAALDAQRRAIDTVPDEERPAARQAYQRALDGLARESRRRFVLRALYSPNQLQEQMTWFWMNHFNVSTRKGEVRALVGDYEENAVRPHALGRFRDLLGATLRHPAMLRYLDNAQNANGRLNENYARELMELHTLGVGGGYAQGDVQELARVLTGAGIAAAGADAPPPSVRPALRGDYVRQGRFEFNPNRHDYGPKTFLGQPIARRGPGEIDEALDRLARAPATARFVSTRLATWFVADVPPPALVARMSAAFERSDGDIAAVLTAMFESPEFAASLGDRFSDPVRYAIGGVRLVADGRVASDVDPLIGWIARMGEPIYGHETPDGHPLTRDAWASAGQMATRFEIARAIGANGAVLFRTDGAAPPAVAPLAASPVVRVLLPTLGAPTREALAQARSPQEWNTLLLAGPEQMNR